MISRNSAFVYKGKPINAQSVANELGVQYVVEGSVRRAGSRVRITAQLIDAETDRHLWAERCDRELADIFAIQDEVTFRLGRSSIFPIKVFESKDAPSNVQASLFRSVVLGGGRRPFARSSPAERRNGCAFSNRNAGRRIGVRLCKLSPGPRLAGALHWRAVSAGSMVRGDAVIRFAAQWVFYAPHLG